MKNWIISLLGLGRIKTELEQSVKDFAELRSSIEELRIINREIYDKLDDLEILVRELVEEGDIR